MSYLIQLLSFSVKLFLLFALVSNPLIFAPYPSIPLLPILEDIMVQSSLEWTDSASKLYKRLGKTKAFVQVDTLNQLKEAKKTSE